MGSLADRYLDLIAEMKRIGWKPDQQRLDEIGAELVELDHRLRTEIGAGREYNRLDEMRGAAHDLLSSARSRHQIELDTTRAAREREAYDAAHPTILSPQQNAFRRVVEHDFGFER